MSVQDLTVVERDRLAVGYINRARENIDEALKALPNHVDSLFVADDTRRLDLIRADLAALDLDQELDEKHGPARPAGVRGYTPTRDEVRDEGRDPDTGGALDPPEEGAGDA